MNSNKLILSLAAILLMIAGIFTACNGEEPEIEIFPQEISFTEFSLVGDDCQWASFEAGKVIVINSTEELRNFILCRDDGRFFQIDFSKYSFLLLRGNAESAVFYIDIDFSKRAANEYVLNLKVHTDMSDVAQTWIAAGIVPKITSGANIVLNTQEIQDTHCTEIDLEGTNWRLIGVVNTETGFVNAPEPRFQNNFTISFEPTQIGSLEALFRVQVESRIRWLRHEFNSNTCAYSVIRIAASSMRPQTEYANMINRAYYAIEFFTLRNTQPRILLLHYRDIYDSKNYILKYKEIENEETGN